MTHQSENTYRLNVNHIRITNVRQLSSNMNTDSDVWLIILPFGRRIQDIENSPELLEQFNDLAEKMGPNSVLSILTSPEEAAVIWPSISKSLCFQLWISVKLGKPINEGYLRLPEHHAALLILSKYKGSLRHTKTRIAYTYCPACDKTTKDYGGKKHTYHEYGTLISDVWRDIAWSPDREPTVIIERLSDMFGLEPHRQLKVINLRQVNQIKPNKIRMYHSRDLKKNIGQETKCDNFNSQLIQGDCVKVLKSIDSNSVDFCFADPPYNLDKRYDRWDDALDIIKYFEWCDQWIDELVRVLKPGRTCAILNIPQWTIRHFSHLQKNLRFQNWIVWEGLSLPVRMIMPAHYSIICFTKGIARELPGLLETDKSKIEIELLSVLREYFCVRSSCIKNRRENNVKDSDRLTDLWWDIHRLKHNSKRVDHPCQLPPILMQRLIAIFTKSKEIVLDPFNGAGTTTLCAEFLERRFIGIELSTKYHELALQRHQLLQRGGDPFEKNGIIPKTKNNRVKRIGNIEYEVPKKVLQLEVRHIAKKLGRLPTREDVKRMSSYPYRYFDEYFISWGEVCAAARTTGMIETRRVKKIKPEIKQKTLFDNL